MIEEKVNQQEMERKQLYEHAQEFYKQYGLVESENYAFFDPFLTQKDYSDKAMDEMIEGLQRYWHEYGTD